MNGEEIELFADVLELVDRRSSSLDGWPFVKTCRDGGGPRPMSPMLGGWGVTNPPTNPPSSDSSTKGGRGGDSMPCIEGFRLEVVTVLLREELDIRPVSGLVRWGLFCELAASRREERTEDRLSLREWPLASDRCFCSEAIFRYIVCLPRRPCSKFVITFRTSGR